MTSPPIRFSRQTIWMLAVRDSRDRVAFGELFDHFAPRLKGLIMRTGTSAGQAEDIVQEVMLTVWRKAEQFDPQRAQVSAWIYQIARNRQIDMIRKERRPLPEEIDGDVNAEPDAGQIMAVEQEAQLAETGADPAAPRPAGHDRKGLYGGAVSHQEISAQTGLPLGTIKSRIRLGLERLRRELKDMR